MAEYGVDNFRCEGDLDASALSLKIRELAMCQLQKRRKSGLVFDRTWNASSSQADAGRTIFLWTLKVASLVTTVKSEYSPASYRLFSTDSARWEVVCERCVSVGRWNRAAVACCAPGSLTLMLPGETVGAGRTWAKAFGGEDVPADACWELLPLLLAIIKA